MAFWLIVTQFERFQTDNDVIVPKCTWVIIRVPFATAQQPFTSRSRRFPYGNLKLAREGTRLPSVPMGCAVAATRQWTGRQRTSLPHGPDVVRGRSDTRSGRIPNVLLDLPVLSCHTLPYFLKLAPSYRQRVRKIPAIFLHLLYLLK